MDNKMNRRGFFSTMVKLTGAAAVAPALLTSLFSAKAEAQKKRGESPAAGGAMPMVDPNDSVAKAVSYVEDNKKAPEAKGNKCQGCGFYAKKEVRNGKEVGTCTIFAGKLVYADAWCKSWNKKA
ncbi:MAG: high-potential iron-sulfur protein [Pseudobdellovibrionaceae bacterium]